MLNCRACGSNELQKVESLSFNFMGVRDDSSWNNYFCTNCGSLSHFIKDSSKEVHYSDSSYRTGKASFYPPISLPWSDITYKRHEKIFSKLDPYLKKYHSKYQINILDFGGYNGFTSYGLKQRIPDSKVTVADLDPNGLKIANAIGHESINLDKEEIIENLHNVCIINHVLEHLEDPIDVLSKLNSNLAKNCICYIEVPNLYGFPVSDEAHLMSFSSKGLVETITQSGLEIIEIGYSTTPKSSVLYEYPLAHSQENLYAICKGNNSLIKQDISKFVYEFQDDVPLVEKTFLRRIKLTNFKLGLITIRNNSFVAFSFFMKAFISLSKLLLPKSLVDRLKNLVRR
tara:strand:- start:2779 stop:3807 length:1029 start_codon:yes stop_codon:yes gene_type:complete